MKGNKINLSNNKGTRFSDIRRKWRPIFTGGGKYVCDGGGRDPRRALALSKNAGVQGDGLPPMDNMHFCLRIPPPCYERVLC